MKIMKLLTRFKIYFLHKRYFTKEFEPIRCFECESDDIKTIIKDRIDYTPCETVVVCKECETELNHWCYGQYQPVVHI
ncbi:MAG: hypothetical protein [Caudoviricetes sp.]|nr:MAG: hypothetical protein [Caudoviricetes sp.]